MDTNKLREDLLSIFAHAIPDAATFKEEILLLTSDLTTWMGELSEGKTPSNTKQLRERLDALI